MRDQAKIMILDPAGNMWGSERVLLDFLNSKIVIGREIGLCCPPDTPLALEAKKTGISIYPFFQARLHERGRFSRLFAAIGLYRACKQLQANIIYVNQAGASRIALFVGRLLNIPVIPHVRLLEDVRYIESLRSNENLMPRVLAISKFIANAFNNPEMKARVQVFYDGYSMSGKNKKSQPKLNSSNELCCAGRLVRIKGQDVIIRAMSELRTMGLFPSLSIYGSGLKGDDFESYLFKLVQDLDLTNQVVFNGFVDDVPSEMQRHQAVVIPSEIEPLGRVIFEAWDAFCVPIVGSFSGGGAEVIIASRGGLLFDENNPRSLAAAIAKFLELSLPERIELVERGRTWVRENCDLESYSIKIIKILDEVA